MVKWVFGKNTLMNVFINNMFINIFINNIHRHVDSPCSVRTMAHMSDGGSVGLLPRSGLR
eukprot:1394835-Amorphochlora_amoeboformis.AAC.1